jgi:large subunit ribosomal protein L21
MYAVIKTGGKQYRVKAGDMLIVEKLAGEPGAKVAFDQVLMVGEGAAVTVGAPTIAGASVSATLIETRRGEKIKIFKKKRRQGYRRTGGHRQTETVLRVTAVAGGGKTETWDGEVNLTPKSLLDLRARNLDKRTEAPVAKAPKAEPAPKPEAKAEAKPAPKKAAPAKAKAKAEPKAAAKEAKPAKASKKPAAAETAAPKAPTGKAQAKGATPKMTKVQAKSPVRRSAPRGGKG